MDWGLVGAVEHGHGAAVRRRTWATRAVKALAVLYPLSLLGVTGALHYVGEQWWVTSVGLYLPRVGFGLPLPFVALLLLVLGQKRWVWTQLASAAVLVFVLMGFVLPWPHSAHPGAPVLKVLSYNIDSARAGVGGIVQEIDAHSPDVVFLQEVGRADDLGRLLKSRYPTVNATNQFVLASRYPLSAFEDQDKLPYLGRQRSPRFLRYVLDTPLGRIVFYSVHPNSPREALAAVHGQGLRREILSGRLFSGAAAPVVKENTGLRKLQVETFSEAAAKETGPVVIAGDTNLPWLSGLFGHYLSAYQDGFQKASWGFGYTFPNDRRPWMRIDRILATAQLRFVRFDVGTSVASDHRCVMAELQRLEL
jgi:vancomycin resistance protein VanJ